MTAQSILEDHVRVDGKYRNQWPNKLQFLCANISYAVGLGTYPLLSELATNLQLEQDLSKHEQTI